MYVKGITTQLYVRMTIANIILTFSNRLKQINRKNIYQFHGIFDKINFQKNETTLNTLQRLVSFYNWLKKLKGRFIKYNLV